MTDQLQRYRILIAEDEAFISEELKSQLEDFGHEVIGIATDFLQAKELLKEQPDFCFLDIRMKGKDVGFEIAHYINKNYQIPFIFLTSFGNAEMVQKAVKYAPAGYLVKPFKTADIYSTLEVSISKSKQSSISRIPIKDGNKSHFVKPDEILYCKASNVYVEVKCTDKTLLERISLDKFSERLPPQFKRAHRSYVVNVNHIAQKTSKELTVGGEIIPISKSNRGNF